MLHKVLVEDNLVLRDALKTGLEARGMNHTGQKLKGGKMKVCDYHEVEAQAAEVEGVTVRWVISEADGAPHFAMRIFDLQPGHGSPLHSHWWEHEVFVLAGTGTVTMAGKRSPIKEGTVVFVPGDVEHQFVNQGDAVLRFICLIPHPWLEGVAEKHRPAELPEHHLT